ncbi:hypothetical protein APHAL10511_007329 [Amanita phalloides]|nr:hypothetical protein APHAL10511_007329 [Amanita phalloides]
METVDPDKAAPLSVSSTILVAGEPRKEQLFECPEGGVQAWLTVAGGTLIQFCSFGYVNAFGVYQYFYVSKYLSHYSPSDIGWIGGAQVFLTFFMGVLTGNAFDRGYFRHLLVASTLLHALALYTLSVTQENQYCQIFLAQGICLGLSHGLTYTPSFAIVSHYFQRRKTLAIGLVSSGASLGAIIHPILLNRLINGPIGFHNAVRISASLNVSLLIIANILCKTRLPPRTSMSRLQVIEFFKDPPYICLIICIFLTFCGLFFPFFYLQIDAVNHNVNPTLAFYVFSILNTANWVGRAIPTAFATVIGVYNAFTACTVAMGIVLLCMAAVKDASGIVLVAIFYGFFAGATVSLAPAVLGGLARNVDEIGARIGIAFGICAIMALFAQPISGALLTGKLLWLHAILFAGLAELVSAVFGIVACRFVVLRKGSWKV